MEVRQLEISQDMERKLTKIQGQMHKRYQEDAQLMQEEHKKN